MGKRIIRDIMPDIGITFLQLKLEGVLISEGWEKDTIEYYLVSDGVAILCNTDEKLEAVKDAYFSCNYLDSKGTEKYDVIYKSDIITYEGSLYVIFKAKARDELYLNIMFVSKLDVADNVLVLNVYAGDTVKFLKDVFKNCSLVIEGDNDYIVTDVNYDSLDGDLTAPYAPLTNSCINRLMSTASYKGGVATLSNSTLAHLSSLKPLMNHNYKILDCYGLLRGGIIQDTEILEEACKVFAGGLRNVNIPLLAGNNVTYNATPVPNNTEYDLTITDSQFYIGQRDNITIEYLDEIEFNGDKKICIELPESIKELNITALFAGDRSNAKRNTLCGISDDIHQNHYCAYYPSLTIWSIQSNNIQTCYGEAITNDIPKINNQSYRNNYSWIQLCVCGINSDNYTDIEVSFFKAKGTYTTEIKEVSQTITDKKIYYQPSIGEGTFKFYKLDNRFCLGKTLSSSKALYPFTGKVKGAFTLIGESNLKYTFKPCKINDVEGYYCEELSIFYAVQNTYLYDDVFNNNGVHYNIGFEPKEGDWFYLMNFSKSNGDLTHDYFLDFPTLSTREHFLQELFLNGTVFLVVGYDNNTKKTFGLSGVGGSRVGIQGETNPYNMYRLTKKIGVGAELIARTDIEYTFRNEKQLFSSRISTNKDVESGCDENGTFSLLLFKQITPSDILAYQATGKMGALFLGNLTSKEDNVYHAQQYYNFVDISDSVVVENDRTKEKSYFFKIEYDSIDNKYPLLFQFSYKIYKEDGTTSNEYVLLTLYSTKNDFGELKVINGMYYLLKINAVTKEYFAKKYPNIERFEPNEQLLFRVQKQYEYPNKDAKIAFQYAEILKDNTSTAQTLSIDE